MKLTSYCDIIK